MSDSTLIDRVKAGCRQVAPDVEEWIENGLKQAGPWNSKPDDKSRLNCFFRYHLISANENTSNEREYLTDQDDDDTWVESVITHVLPAVSRSYC